MHTRGIRNLDTMGRTQQEDQKILHFFLFFFCVKSDLKSEFDFLFFSEAKMERRSEEMCIRTMQCAIRINDSRMTEDV